MAKPSKAAIAALRKDPALSTEFDAKYGSGASAPHLQGTGELTDKMAELLALQGETNTRLDRIVAQNEALVAHNQALLAHLQAPKRHRVILNDKGEVTGVETVKE